MILYGFGMLQTAYSAEVFASERSKINLAGMMQFADVTFASAKYCAMAKFHANNWPQHAFTQGCFYIRGTAFAYMCLPIGILLA